ncbi:MAG: serine/threonine-protein kinase [Planctomycetota bacterium]|nr:serine/threonine-protein kinase [Planctomycetota bacterium]
MIEDPTANLAPPPAAGSSAVPGSSGATPARSFAEPENLAGVSIGPYRVLQQLGEGGFGAVYLAEQVAPVQRKVALKVLKLGMDSRQVVARFEQERQALALMDHPHIARVLDAGVSDRGRPYFVMELCTGKPVTEFADRASLDVPARLALFNQVCAAVQHAHQKGIIHRDLKPSNILVSEVDGAPHAKVIDFGIAKALAGPLTDKTFFTEHRQLIGTPQYMSPEQAEGSLDIDTRADVYALGVLLYELLTGSTPINAQSLATAPYAEMQRLLREQVPVRPSLKLSALRTAPNAPTPPSAAIDVRLVRGELDWIVMRAIEKDRARRYPSAGSLAEDVGRYLRGEPVQAAPPSVWYTTRTFVRRHRALVAGAAVVTLTLILGIVGTSVGLVSANRQRAIAQAAETRARERLAESEATVQFLDDMLAAADPAVQGRDVPVRAVLDCAAGTLSTRFADRPLVAARLHATIGRTYAGLGENTTAGEHVRSALELRTRELGADHPDTRRAVNDQLAQLVRAGEFNDAEPQLREAIARNEKLFGRASEITADSIELLALLLSDQQMDQDAIAPAREAYASRLTSFGKDDARTVRSMTLLATILGAVGQGQEAQSLFTDAIAVSTRLFGADHPNTLDIRSNFAWALYWTARNAEGLSRDEARAMLERSREVGEQTLAARTRVLGEEHHETQATASNLAITYRSLGLNDDFDRLALRGIEISTRTLGAEHPDTIISLSNYGAALRDRGRCDESEAYLQRALDLSRKVLPPDSPGTAYVLGWLGSCKSRTGKFAEGEPLLIEAFGIISSQMGPTHRIARQMAIDLASLYKGWDAAEPAKGHAAQQAQWEAKAKKPAEAPPAAPSPAGQ